MAFLRQCLIEARRRCGDCAPADLLPLVEASHSTRMIAVNRRADTHSEDSRRWAERIDAPGSKEDERRQAELMA